MTTVFFGAARRDRMLNGLALLVGWMIGTTFGRWLACPVEKSVISAVSIFRMNVPTCIAFYALAANLVISVILSTAEPRSSPSLSKDKKG